MGSEKYHIMRPLGGGTERIRKVFCGATVVRDRMVAENKGRFYTRHALGYSEIDSSMVCGNCKRHAGIAKKE